uniref:AcidPPc domain-containing protein n=1 Tax=Syphacia muris TaxID=451379 RepID=A0A0N5AUC8_9BILA
MGFEPYHRGFFCDDQSIRMPYKPDSVTPLLLMITILLMLFGTIAATEFYLHLAAKDTEHTLYFVRGCKVNPTFLRFCTYSSFCIFGLAINMVICNMTKYFVGRLRPHFLDVCRPNINISECTDPLVYVTNYTCTFEGISGNTVAGYSLKKNARLSFFSGHSSTTMHVAIFCAIYLYARLPRRMYGVSLLPIFQTILVVIALVVGYSRISDHKHHWSDVLCGFIVGIITGTISAIYIGQLLNRQPFTLSQERVKLLVDSNDDTVSMQQLNSPIRNVNLSAASAESFPHHREHYDHGGNGLDGIVVS